MSRSPAHAGGQQGWLGRKRGTTAQSGRAGSRTGRQDPPWSSASSLAARTHPSLAWLCSAFSPAARIHPRAQHPPHQPYTLGLAVLGPPQGASLRSAEPWGCSDCGCAFLGPACHDKDGRTSPVSAAVSCAPALKHTAPLMLRHLCSLSSLHVTDGSERVRQEPFLSDIIYLPPSCRHRDGKEGDLSSAFPLGMEVLQVSCSSEPSLVFRASCQGTWWLPSPGHPAPAAVNTRHRDLPYTCHPCWVL